jgi:glycogen(starch) synthase
VRILELTWEYPPHLVGGIASHMAALAPALSELGADVTVVTPRIAGGNLREDHAGLSIYRAVPPVLAEDLLVNVQQTNVELDRLVESLFDDGHGFDVIHAHDWLVALAAIGLKHRHRIPLVATIHATERGRNRGHLGSPQSHAISNSEWWLSYEAWRVITASEFMAAELHDYFAVPTDKIDIVPNGVETAPFDALETSELTTFRERYARPGERIVFTVGRLVHEKGAQLLIEAVPAVIRRQPDVKFVIAGTGPMLGDLHARTHDLAVENHVEFVGYISNADRNSLFKVADCAVFPSLYEPFGIVALEAMASKCPLVVASTGGLAQVVQNHVTGITVYPGSVESLADGILHVLKYPDWSFARAMRAYRIVAQNYNWREIAEQTYAVLMRVVDYRANVDW